ncbi:MAG TPA: addiction module protein [Reyranellaceae bacterium]|nr:addiction module protein [Reyranellaceae bacterium]
MTNLVEDIERQIRTLKLEEKTELLRVLIAELDGSPDADAEQAWLELARRRHREIVEGKVKTVPAAEVFKRGRSRLKR